MIIETLRRTLRLGGVTLIRNLVRSAAHFAMASPSGWLFTVGFNVAKRRLRRQRWETGFWRSERPRVENAPAGELWILVASLPARQRQAVALRHVGQLTEREIADVMGISRGAVSSTLRSAYQAMRIELAEAPVTQEMT